MHDAIVIGAGHNGLVAANLLADAGWSVLVLEAEHEPGGAVRSAEVTAPGYVNDLFSAFYPLGYASPVLQALDLHRHGLRWRHAPAVLAHPLEDGRCAVLSRDVDVTCASVDAFAPGDGQAWLRMYEQWCRIGPDLVAALLRPFPPVRPAWRLLRSMGVPEALRFARFAVQPVRRFGEEQFAGEGGTLLLAGNTLHTDLTPDGAGGAIFGWLLAMLGQQVGFPVPEGGSGRLTAALVARLKDRGGHLECDRPVREVVIRRGRAIGVRTRDGQAAGARHAVLADVAAPILYRSLVGPEHLPPRLLADLNRFTWDHATLKVDWALSGPVPWTAAEAGRAGTVHLGGGLTSLSQYATALANRQVPAEPFMIVGQMTTADPTRSPAGTESAWAYTHLPRGPLDGRAVTAQAHRLEEVVERYAPGFRDLIAARRISGPGDLERADASLVGGAVNGGSAALHQQLLFRPVPGLGRPETPVRGLYLAGSSAHPGGGVHGACGSNAARAALLRRHAGGRLVSGGLQRLTRALG